MQDVDDFLKAHPAFVDKTLNLELIGKIEDKNLKNALKEWSKTERPKDIHEIRGELRRTIIKIDESAREFKAGCASKAFSTYLDDTFGEAARRIHREELEIKKTIDNMQKIKTDEKIIEFFHLG